MFIRKKKNRSGTTSVVVVEKSHGKFTEVRTIGVSGDDSEISRLCALGRQWIDRYCGGEDIFIKHTQEQEERKVTDSLLSNIENILLNGTKLILDRVYDSIGFDKMEDNILKQLVANR